MSLRRRAFAALLAVLAAPAGAWTPELDTTTLTPRERLAAQALIERVNQRLPAAMAARLPALRLAFDALPPAVHGRIRGQRIVLARRLLDGDGADAALLHELAHAFDRRARLARDPRLLDLAGWQLRPRRFGLRGRNRLVDRSPDAYELTSPREFVAVNLEHFLLDPEYACRRPTLFDYFTAHLGAPRHAPARCEAALPLVLPGDQTPLQALDPARVYRIDYLLAEPTGALASRWGHAMLRLVICAPERTPGPDCRLDLAHHRVLSFRAFVDDVQISGWRGLTGRYPSRLFVLPLDQVIEEYTATELRGLRAVPLRLSAKERAGLLRRAAQLHWSYDGRYAFLGNNCASEIFKLLHDGVPRLAQAPIAAITPTALLRRLERAGIADSAPLRREDAVRLGYLFPPADRHYAELFELARAALALPARDAPTWLDLPASRRAPWMARGDLRASAALLVLEEAALRRAELRARDAIKRQLLRHRGDALRTLFDQALTLEGTLLRPAALLDGVPGYGLPQAAELQWLGQRADAAQRRLEEHRQRLHALAREALPPDRREALDGARRNLQRLSAHLRQLAAKDAATPAP